MNDVRITITEFRHVIFDKRELKAALRSGAKIILSEARRLISTKAVSGDGGETNARRCGRGHGPGRFRQRRFGGIF